MIHRTKVYKHINLSKVCIPVSTAVYKGLTGKKWTDFTVHIDGEKEPPPSDFTHKNMNHRQGNAHLTSAHKNVYRKSKKRDR